MEEQFHQYPMHAEQQMNIITPAAPLNPTERVSPASSSSSEQFRAWAQSREGQRLWRTLRIPLSVERLCHVLEQASADTSGLLVSPQGTIILSTTHQETFARLEPRYRAAAEAGLCFWWEGGTLVRILESEVFLERVRALPSLTDRVWRAQQAAHRHRNLLEKPLSSICR